MKRLLLFICWLWVVSLPALTGQDPAPAPPPLEMPEETPSEAAVATEPVDAPEASETDPSAAPAPDSEESVEAPVTPAPAESSPVPETSEAETLPDPVAAVPRKPYVAPAPAPRANGEPVLVYVVPITEEISPANAYILRRALKDAINAQVEAVVLDINTPGGRLDVTLDMMAMLDKFEGTTLAFVNDEAISAGAYIAAACEEIHFAPQGVIGAAAVIQGTGEDVPETARSKINSYLNAKVRALTSEYPYRADVIRAMMDENFVLMIDDEVLKPEGELLSLTAEEALQTFGDPPRPLFGSGIHADVEELLRHRFGEGGYSIRSFEVTWSERLAKFLTSISPILLGLGMLLLAIEFKTPGFGIMGISGIALLLVVFASNYVAGLAGYEPMIFFLLGAILLFLELFVLPGVVVLAFSGIVLMAVSLLWSMADIWPSQGPSSDGLSQFDFSVFWGPIYDLLLGFLLALVGLVLVWRFLPKTGLWHHLVLENAQPAPDPALAVGGPAAQGLELPAPGQEGVAATDLHPLGEIEIDGCRYQAVVDLGAVRRGQPVVVTGRRDLALLVEPR